MHAEQPLSFEPVTDKPLMLLQLARQFGGWDVEGGGGAVVLGREVDEAAVIGEAVETVDCEVGGGEGALVPGDEVVAGTGFAVVVEGA